ncbi:hypothetical protein HID58_054875 [Brassica napus]|uniref:Uncharacterized protein n=1 Tax=Brassica napus TaxID=3708 RepID=A0ABQ8AK20_BRANA|nr:hypothetical protein HID58_054875 [Brassica napus]
MWHYYLCFEDKEESILKILSRIGENHLFKWVNETWNEEILMVETRQRTLEEEFEGLRMIVSDNSEEGELQRMKLQKIMVVLELLHCFVVNFGNCVC